jgi:hypothetical protein
VINSTSDKCSHCCVAAPHEMQGSTRRCERAQSSPGTGSRGREFRSLGLAGRRVEQIGEITEEATVHGSRTSSITSEGVIDKLELDKRRQSEHGSAKWLVGERKKMTIITTHPSTVFVA